MKTALVIPLPRACSPEELEGTHALMSYLNSVKSVFIWRTQPAMLTRKFCSTCTMREDLPLAKMNFPRWMLFLLSRLPMTRGSCFIRFLVFSCSTVRCTGRTRRMYKYKVVTPTLFSSHSPNQKLLSILVRHGKGVAD